MSYEGREISLTILEYKFDDRHGSFTFEMKISLTILEYKF